MKMEQLPPIKPSRLGEARDELQRELEVRERLYPRWVEDRRMTRSEAIDRYNRLATALAVCWDAANTMGEDKTPGELCNRYARETSGVPEIDNEGNAVTSTGDVTG